MSTVEAVGVTKLYDSVAALREVSLSFREGELFGLLGPSGSGKTTLLRCIAGFIDPDEGEIRIDGQPVRDTPVHRRDIGMMFQSYALFPHMSVAENVGFGLSVRGVPRAEIAARVKEMLALVRLSGLEARRPRQLSGGQQQRVALARALITRPRVLLLDEPLGALDKRLRQEMQVELKHIQREVGITTIFVTHDQEEALTLSDRIAIFNEGRVVQVGTPSAVYERPGTAFAANFLGDASFFAGKAAGRRDGRSVVRLTVGGEVLTEDPLPADGAPVTLAVRPEKITLRAAGADAVPAGLNSVRGRIVQAVYSGSSISYRIDVGAEAPVLVFEQNRADHTLPEQAEVILSWAPAHTVVVQP
ncbi:MAG: ABC transporter ATP-binding protein [Rhodospirillaceae bacterium]|nr:ABC transporter ATP-binding protein [Rhodospirillaceae bacterium]